MPNPTLTKRLATLEGVRASEPEREYTHEEWEAAAQRYAASLAEPGEPDLRHAAYLASRSLKDIAADTDAMMRGASAPWL